MKIIKTTPDKQTFKYTVAATASKWKEIQEQTKKNLVKQVKVPGFRAGHVPAKVALSKISTADVINAAIKKAVNVTYEELLASKEFVDSDVIEDALTVDIAKVDENNLEIEYDFEKYPDITLGDYKNIKTKYKKPVISAEEIQREIDHMVQKDIMLVPKDQEQIAHGDMVNFDFEGSVDGKPFEGGKAAGYELEIGSNMFIPGFELQMIGLKVGDTKDIKVTFPKDYHAKEMANKEATFNLKINSVKTINKPELDEAYIARFAIPNVKTKQELHAYLEHNIFEHKNYQLRQEAIKIISQHIIDNCKLEFIPNSLLKSEIERLNEDTNKRAEQAKKTLDEFIATSLGFKTRAMYDANVEEVASKNLTLVIAIEKIITELKLTITQNEIDDHINKIAKVYNISIEDVKNRMNNNFDGIKTFLLQEKVFDKLIEMNSDK